AKQEAEKIIGTIRSGETPEAKIATRADGPTLRDALALKVRAMRNDGCAERSIETLESEVARLLSEWMDHPLVAMKRSDLRAVHDRLVDEDKPSLARKIKAHVSTIFNTAEGASDE